MINNSIKKAFHSISFYLIIILFHLPFFVDGKNSYIQILDTLNCEFIYNHILKISNNLFNLNQFEEIQNIIGGWKLLYIHSQFKLIKLFYLFFDSYYAYVLHSIFVRSLGFFGIKLLFNKLLGKIKNENLIFLIFALIPGLTVFGSSLWGLPLLAWSFITLKEKLSYSGIFAIILYVFTSSPYQYPFIGLIIFFFFLWDYFKFKKVNIGIILGGVTFLFFGLVSEFNLLIGVFSNNPEIISHRVNDLSNVIFPSFGGIIYQFFKNLVFGEYNPSHFFSFPILLYTIYDLIKNGFNFKENYFRYYLIILIFIALKVFTPYIIILDIPFLTSFGIEKKILYFIPILFFMILGELIVKNSNDKVSIVVILSLLIFNVLRNTEISYNIFGKKAHYFVDEDYLFKVKLFGDYSKSNHFDIDEFSSLYFDEYFSEELFNEVSSSINKQKEEYKIINLGISPSVTLYNGFYNIDGYLSNHPDTYNKEFNTLQNNFDVRYQHKLRLKYDGFNKICNNCTKKDSLKNIDLDINIKNLKKLNASYIFSTFKINNSRELNIYLLNTFQNEIYKIYVYQI